MKTEISMKLNSMSIKYKVIEHSKLGQIKSAVEFAQKLGVNIKQVAKTLLIKDITNNSFLYVVLSTDKQLNIIKLSKMLNKELKIATIEELKQFAGFEKYETTALTLNYSSILDEELTKFDLIYVGNGTKGEDLEISVTDFIRVTGARVLAI